MTGELEALAVLGALVDEATVGAGLRALAMLASISADRPAMFLGSDMTPSVMERTGDVTVVRIFFASATDASFDAFADPALVAASPGSGRVAIIAEFSTDLPTAFFLRYLQ